MGKQRKTEEQLKAVIFSNYSCYFDEPSSDRRQVYFRQICEAIIFWCTDYLDIKKANEMGIEIFNAVLRLVKDNNTRVPKDENGFFKYLKKVLFTAQKEYYRDIRRNETDNIKISRETLKKLKMVEEMITAQEIQIGKKITEIERRQYISRWFNVVEYTRLTNLIDDGGLETNMRSAATDPQDELLAKFDMENLKDALEQVLLKVQERSRECYRSLFTAYCIDNLVAFEFLTPLLDSETYESYRKDGKKPKQYEIYMKYHPEAEKKSAEVRASTMTKDFLDKLKAAMLEKNQ
jgi:hypothetical protein